MNLQELFALTVKHGASDLFLSADAPPIIKVEGAMRAVGAASLEQKAVRSLIYSILSEADRNEFEQTNELNIAYLCPRVGRFRINVFRQMGKATMVARHVKTTIPDMETLGIPDIFKNLALRDRGLMLLVGGTGTGKSTTLAAMLDYRNNQRSGHILTIEDPVEFVHQHRKSLVSQREVGMDTESYDVALKNAMREAPDVIMIGEIRDLTTMKAALAYAETGHLCLATLHGNNANQALDRILNFFPVEAHRQVLIDLSNNLQAIASQRLPMGMDNKRVAAFEIMVNTTYIAELLATNSLLKIKGAMSQGGQQGCIVLDDALFDLTEAGRIDVSEALRHADSPNNLSLRFRTHGSQQVRAALGRVPDPVQGMSMEAGNDSSGAEGR